ATSFLGGNLRGAITRQLILETGRAAIELYSGRLRLSAHELADAARADTGQAAGEAPLRLLLVGQANAGKTSLLNALAGTLRGEVGPLPGEGPVREHLVTQEGRPALAVADMPPLDDAAAFLAQARRADAILWVCAATQPGRAADLAALTALRDWAGTQPQRRAPPLAVALTGVDRLRPASEWAPPYPPDAPKARSIAAARAAVAEALDLPEDAVVPVALPPGGAAWNVDALWTRLSGEMDAARAARFERLREAGDRVGPREVAGQLGRLGLDAVRAAIGRPRGG
ncbi:MAG TPA: GTPase, partial [Roseococcus sp.]|nr:GTPase [Roseococcus sp.]